MNGRALARREALRIFRLVLIVQLAFLGLSLLALVGLGGSTRWLLLVRAAPTLLLALLFLPPWLEKVLGRYFLALGLGLHVLFSSLEMTYFWVGRSSATLARLGLPPEISQQLASAPPIEPFFFLLIPLVLLAWGYGRRGAVLGSSWASALYLGTGLWLTSVAGYPRSIFIQALARMALLFLVPLIVSILAERERRQHAQLGAAHQRLRRHATTVEQLATSRERNRLARDLHDTLAHSLSALTVQLEALRSLLANDPTAAPEVVDQLVEQARQGLEESRQAIQALRTDPVETLGLVDALQDALQEFQARTGTPATLSTAGQTPDLDGATALGDAEVYSQVGDRHVNAAHPQRVDVKDAVERVHVLPAEFRIAERWRAADDGQILGDV
jgi:signal transduction histidine kinase